MSQVGIAAVEILEDIEAVSISYCIGKAWWGQGYTPEALKCLIDFFIIEVKAKRIEAFHASENKASGRVMAKCGMTCEGTLRQRIRIKQEILDACIYAILAEEVETERTK